MFKRCLRFKHSYSHTNSYIYANPYTNSITPTPTPSLTPTPTPFSGLNSGLEDKRIAPAWKDSQVSLFGQDGFPVNDSRFPNRLFWISKRGNNLGSLYSDDNGNTWHDFAKSSFAGSLYAMGGSRDITSDDYIIGLFGDYHGTTNTADVYFFKINAQ